jgi:TolB-like protein/DNA-binding winged helix-turn-helix (wHTH) protein
MIYYFTDCALDTNLCTLRRDGQTYRLRLKVFRMCLYLLEHRDRVVSREELCTQVWPGQFVSQATLEGVIRLVRQAVGDSGRTQSIIQTLHGHGYRFVANVEEPPLADPDGEAARTDALPVTVAAAVLPESADISTGTLAVHEQEQCQSSGQPEGRRLGSSVGNGHGTDRPAEAYLLGERLGVQPRGGWGWWLPRLGLALAFMTLVVLGGWAVSWEVRGQGTVKLDKSRIAVLPFIDLSAEADQTYVADGLTENLIAELARIDGLTVIARTSVMKYKGSLKDVATIGRELRVGTIVEGSVRRVDNQVRISAQLIDVASQGHLWSREYDRELAGVFDIQSDIATRVAQWLKLQVTAEPVAGCLPAEARSTTVVQNTGRGHKGPETP